MREIVVLWRNESSNDGEDLKRTFACEERLSRSNLSCNVASDSPGPDKFGADNLYPAGQMLLSRLHIKGIVSVVFTNNYLVTIGLFNRMPGLFSWDDRVEQAVAEAFQMALKQLYHDAVVVFRPADGQSAGMKLPDAGLDSEGLQHLFELTDPPGTPAPSEQP